MNDVQDPILGSFYTSNELEMKGGRSVLNLGMGDRDELRSARAVSTRHTFLKQFQFAIGKLATEP